MWFKDLAGYLNLNLVAPDTGPTLTNHPHGRSAGRSYCAGFICRWPTVSADFLPSRLSPDYPYCLTGKELKGIIKGLIGRCAAILPDLLDHCVYTMLRELDRQSGNVHSSAHTDGLGLLIPSQVWIQSGCFWVLNVLRWVGVSIKRRSKNRWNQEDFFLFPGEPLHGYRVCIQAILQDKPKIATQNLPEVCAILFLSDFAVSDLTSDLEGLNNELCFLISIWSSCGQSRVVPWRVWPSCGLSAKLGFTISARGCEVKQRTTCRHPSEGIMSQNVISLIVLNPNLLVAGLLKRHMSTNSHEPELVRMLEAS